MRSTIYRTCALSSTFSICENSHHSEIFLYFSRQPWECFCNSPNPFFIRLFCTSLWLEGWVWETEIPPQPGRWMALNVCVKVSSGCRQQPAGLTNFINCSLMSWGISKIWGMPGSRRMVNLWGLRKCCRTIRKISLYISNSATHLFYDCVFRVTVMLKGEPPAWLQRCSRQIQVFLYSLAAVLGSIYFPSIMTDCPVPTEEKHPHSMMLPPRCFTAGMYMHFSFHQA